jgi:hypothetical protein
VRECSGQRQIPAERGVLQIGHQPAGSGRAGLLKRIPQAFHGNGIRRVGWDSHRRFGHGSIVHGAGKRNPNNTQD